MELFRGGEAVLEQFGLIFPDADIALMTYLSDRLPPDLKRRTYHTSAVHKVPRVREHFRKLLPFFPEVIRSIEIPKRTRFVLSSDASMIKGVSLPKGTLHACYCHSPPRYLWGLTDAYLDASSHNSWWERLAFSASIPRLKAYDRANAQKVDAFIANSKCVQDRIRTFYGRESTVIFPPVNVSRFDHTRPREDFYLIVSALVPYKRVDIAVDACTKLGRKLVVIGTGPEENDLKRRAGPTVTFLGWQDNQSVYDHYERCRAFLFPGIEDFGITPCEAQAAGAPVIAFNQGGALETVRDGVSGLFFTQQTAESLAETVRHFERSAGFVSAACRDNVAHLGPDRFRREMREFLTDNFPEVFEDYGWAETTTTVARRKTIPPVRIARRREAPHIWRSVPADIAVAVASPEVAPVAPTAPAPLTPVRTRRKLTLITNLFSPDELGGAALLTDWAAYFREQGYDINVVTTFSYYPRWQLKPGDKWSLRRDEVMPDGTQVRRVRMYVPSAVSTLNRLLSDLTFFLSLVVFGRSQFRHSQVIVTACPMFSQMLAVRLLCSRGGTQKAAIVQDFVVDAALELKMIRVPFLGPMLKRLERWVFSGFDTLTTISDEMHAKLDAKLDRPVRTLYVPNWIHGSLEQAILRGLGRDLPRVSRRLFYSGNVGRKQGLHLFLNNFHRGSGWTIQINGGGAELHSMVKACEGRPELVVGDVQDEDAYIESLLTCTACLITQLPGVGANFLPSKILPALASGTPILAVCDSDSPLGREVQAAGCGEVVQTDDPAAIARVLDRWANDPDLLALYGRKSRERAALYSRERILGEFQEEIDALLAKADVVQRPPVR